MNTVASPARPTSRTPAASSWLGQTVGRGCWAKAASGMTRRRRPMLDHRRSLLDLGKFNRATFDHWVRVLAFGLCMAYGLVLWVLLCFAFLTWFRIVG